jgi:hypothetical protein
MEMKKTGLFFVIWISCVVYVFARQNSVVCRGTVRDHATNSPLQNVRIYYRDTIPVYSNSAGEFQITARPGDKLHFRKAGYGWHTKEITGEEDMPVDLAASKPEKIIPDFGNTYRADYTELLYDGKPVPFEEWIDACSSPHDDIISLQIIRGKYEQQNGRVVVLQKKKIIYISVFQWNQKE